MDHYKQQYAKFDVIHDRQAVFGKIDFDNFNVAMSCQSILVHTIVLNFECSYVFMQLQFWGISLLDQICHICCLKLFANSFHMVPCNFFHDSSFEQFQALFAFFDLSSVIALSLATMVFVAWLVRKFKCSLMTFSFQLAGFFLNLCYR